MEKIGIDTPIIIYLLEAHPKFLPRARTLFDDIEGGKYTAVFSSIGMIELLTGAKKQKRLDLAADYRELLGQFPNLTIVGINEQIVEHASDLRAKYALATPDAIHLATAIDFGAKRFITNDRRLKKVKEIVVDVIG